MTALPSLSEKTAYRTIRSALRANWPADDDLDVRRAAHAIVYQCGPRAERIAIALAVIEATRKGVNAGCWPPGYLRACSDLILASLDLALANVSAVEVAMVLRLLATGQAPAVGIQTGGIQP